MRPEWKSFDVISWSRLVLNSLESNQVFTLVVLSHTLASSEVRVPLTLASFAASVYGRFVS